MSYWPTELQTSTSYYKSETLGLKTHKIDIKILADCIHVSFLPLNLHMRSAQKVSSNLL